MSDELLRLADRIEAASGADRHLDALIATTLRVGTEHSWAYNYPAWIATECGRVHLARNGPNFIAHDYTASLDSAAALVPEGDDYSVSREGTMGVACVYRGASAEPISGEAGAATPPLALCVAALRARASRLRMEVE